MLKIGPWDTTGYTYSQAKRQVLPPDYLDFWIWTRMLKMFWPTKVAVMRRKNEKLNLNSLGQAGSSADF